jgi:hypothetical protein
MIRRSVLAPPLVALCAFLIWPERALSQNFYAGTAAGGQPVNVDLGSIRVVSSSSVDFVYSLGAERIYSQANCVGRYWTTFPERARHVPRSPATSNMLNKVCSYLGQGMQPTSPARSQAGVAIVFDPPSNVRSTPNGQILCSVRTRGSINIYGQEGEWYVTDFCGPRGFIHRSQIRF